MNKHIIESLIKLNVMIHFIVISNIIEGDINESLFLSFFF